MIVTLKVSLINHK